MCKTLNVSFLNICKIISISCILISIVSWIPNLCGVSVISWPVSVTISPIGFIMALILLFKFKCKIGILLAILNIIMFFSVVILLDMFNNFMLFKGILNNFFII